MHLGSLRLIPVRPIGLPHDGADFIEDTPSDCAAKLNELRAIGYHVPQSAIDALLEESE